MSETQEHATQSAPGEGETVHTPATDTVPNSGQEQQADTAESESEPEPKRKPWFQQRIDELTREKHEARRQAENLAAHLRQMHQVQQGSQQDSATPPAGYVPASEVQRIAAQQVASERFTEACNEIADFGAEKFPDFDDAVSNFQMLGGPTPAFLEAVTALGKEDGAKVFRDLGTDPDNAARILRMSPARMAVELTKMAAKPRPSVSKVPDPVRPLNAAGTRANDDYTRMTDAEQVAWFRKSLAARNN